MFVLYFNQGTPLFSEGGQTERRILITEEDIVFQKGSNVKLIMEKIL